MVHYGLNRIKLCFAAHYKTVILTLLTYLVTLALSLASKATCQTLAVAALKDHWPWP